MIRSRSILLSLMVVAIASLTSASDASAQSIT